MLSYLQTKNNNIKQVVIEFAFNKLIYNFKINDILKILTNILSKNYNQLRFIKKKAKFVITFVNVINKTRYNLHYKIINDFIKIKVIIYFCFYQKYIISKLVNKKLFN